MIKQQPKIPTKADSVADALGSVRAEGLEPSAKTLEMLQKFASGEMTAFELAEAISAKNIIKKDS